MQIFAGSDHAGFDLKLLLSDKLAEMGHTFIDLGTHTRESCDYPEYAHQVAKAVLSHPVSMGLLICGSGIGISIAANRHRGIRAALCRSGLEAKLSRRHNNSNILVLGGRITGVEAAIDIVETFFKTEFEGGRHQARIEKIEL